MQQVLGGIFGLLFVAGFFYLVLMIVRKTLNLFKKKIICPNPNCGYKGFAKKQARGNTMVGIILLIPFVFPGLFYFMFKGGYRYSCPNCGMQVANDN